MDQISPSTPLKITMYILDEDDKIDSSTVPIWTLDFTYDWLDKDAFGREKIDVPVEVPETLLKEVLFNIITNFQ